jgi:amidohydrolase
MRMFSKFAAAAVSLVLSGALLHAQDPLPRIEQEVAKITPAVTEIRHRLHQYPELSNREEKTAAEVADYLRKLGLEVQTGVARHGVVALLKGGLSGPVVAVRADMDALPVTEETNLPFASKVRTTYLGQEVGVMHACGHDVHTAVQLGVASVLTSMKASLPGTVKFIFQPAEEGAPPGETGGASLMVKEGVLQNPRPQAIFGLHAFSEMPVGDIGYSEGPALSASDTWEVKIVGKQAHGARPELSIDPVVTAAQFVQALQTIRSRTFSGHEPGVVTIGTIHGGQRHNIIPAEVTLTGTIRDERAGRSAAPRDPQGRDRGRGRHRRSRTLRARRAGDDQSRSADPRERPVARARRRQGTRHPHPAGDGVGGLLLLRQ